jgi:hypothetical protein
MSMTIVAGMFGSVHCAERAKAELERMGIPGHAIALSVNLTDDPVGAEFPGQSYENQNYRSSDQIDVGGWTDTERARYAEEVRSAACVVTVRVQDDMDDGLISAILRREGARRAMSRPD